MTETSFQCLLLRIPCDQTEQRQGRKLPEISRSKERSIRVNALQLGSGTRAWGCVREVGRRWDQGDCWGGGDKGQAEEQGERKVGYDLPSRLSEFWDKLRWWKRHEWSWHSNSCYRGAPKRLNSRKFKGISNNRLTRTWPGESLNCSGSY